MILCVGLSPTVQRTLWFTEPVEPGKVHRAKQAWTTASGKAVNVARMVSQLGATSHLVHPLGAETGQLVRRLLEADGVAQTVIDTPERPTRVCTTILDGRTTELVEEAPSLASSEIERTLEMASELLPLADLLCFSGSLPVGATIDFLHRIMNAAETHGVDVLVDAANAPLRAVLEHGPWLAKPNRLEGCASLGLDPSTPADAVARALRDSGARNALVTDGPGEAVLATESGIHRLPSLGVEAFNPIGSGDAVAAGIAVARTVHRMPWPEAGRFAIAVGAANCLSPTSGVVDPNDVTRLFGPWQGSNS